MKFLEITGKKNILKTFTYIFQCEVMLLPLKKRILGVSYIFPRGANKLVCIFIDIDHVLRILAVFL